MSRYRQDPTTDAALGRRQSLGLLDLGFRALGFRAEGLGLRICMSFRQPETRAKALQALQ